MQSRQQDVFKHPSPTEYPQSSPSGKWGTVVHWLEHCTHDHKVVGSSHDLSSLCRVPEQDS